MTSNELNKYMVDALNHKGHVAYRENTAIAGKQKRKLPKESLGIGDVVCCLKPTGHHIEFEGKVGNDKPKPSQIERQKRIVESGGGYFFISSIEQFHIILSRSETEQMLKSKIIK